MKMKLFALLFVLLTATLLLVACGGPQEPAASTEAPVSTASAATEEVTAPGANAAPDGETPPVVSVAPSATWPAMTTVRTEPAKVTTAAPVVTEPPADDPNAWVGIPQ